MKVNLGHFSNTQHIGLNYSSVNYFDIWNTM